VDIGFFDPGLRRVKGKKLRKRVEVLVACALLLSPDASVLALIEVWREILNPMLL
jgi:hypothetical protein